MSIPVGTLCILKNKDGTLDEMYDGRECIVLSALDQNFVGTNRFGELCKYAAYGCDVEGETTMMFAKHVWLVPKQMPHDPAFDAFMETVLQPVDLKITEEV